MAEYEEHVRRKVITELGTEVHVQRQNSTGMVWLRAPSGVALDREEAWQLARALIFDEEPKIVHVDRGRANDRPSPIQWPWKTEHPEDNDK